MAAPLLLSAVNASGSWRLREINHQLGLRGHNEELDASIRLAQARVLASYRCECSDSKCRERIELSRREYAAVRTDGARFAIAVDHEDPELDLLVGEGSRYATIEKLPGPAARMAVATDPRPLLGEAR